MPPSSQPGLRRILAAYAANELGRWFALIALSLAVLQRTHSALAVGAVLAAPLLPALLAPLLIAQIERSRQRSPLSLLYLLQGFAALATALLLWRFWLPGVLLLAALDGAASFAARGLLRSQAAQQSPAEGQGADTAAHGANAALNVLFALTGIAGPALAGLVVGQFGGPVALLLDSTCMTLCAWLTLGIGAHVESAAAGLLARLGEVAGHIRRERRLAALFAAEGAAFVCFASAIPLEVTLIKQSLHIADVGYGLFEASWGLGLFVGSVVFARSGKRAERRRLKAKPARLGHSLMGPAGPYSLLLPIGTLAVAVAFIALAVAPSLTPACLAALLGGFGNGIQWASALGMMQSLSPRALLARVTGLFEGAGAVAPIAGYAIGGFLPALIGVRAGLLLAGGGGLLLLPAFLWLSAQSLDEPELRGTTAGERPAEKPHAATSSRQVGALATAKPLK